MSKRNKGRNRPARLVGPRPEELVDIKVADLRPPEVAAKPLSEDEFLALVVNGLRCPRCGNGRKNAKADGVEVWWCAECGWKIVPGEFKGLLMWRPR